MKVKKTGIKKDTRLSRGFLLAVQEYFSPSWRAVPWYYICIRYGLDPSEAERTWSHFIEQKDEIDEVSHRIGVKVLTVHEYATALLEDADEDQ